MAHARWVASVLYDVSIFVALLFMKFFLLKADNFCRQQNFNRAASGDSLTTNVISSQRVDSIMDCSQHCLREAACVGFNYLTKDKDREPNCQLANTTEHTQINNNENKVEDWTFYITSEATTAICLENPCRNGGTCVENACQPEGFVCECSTRYKGRLCEMEKVFKSCNEVLESSSYATSGTYNIETSTARGYTKVYCHMTSLPGCSGGGWTMVMKIDGNKSNFLYNSEYWNNSQGYHLSGGQSSFDELETQLPTYNSTPFHELCLGMKVNNDLKFVFINYTETTSMYSLLADGNFRPTNLGRQKWKSLIDGSSLQDMCNKEGFNAHFADSTFAAVRIGFVANENPNCDSPDSFVGFGGQVFTHTSYCNISPSGNACGNLASCRGDNGDKNIKAMGYILVR